MEVQASKQWLECKAQPNILSSVPNHPISMPSCDTIDESEVPIFLKTDSEISEHLNEKNWSSKQTPFLC